MAVTLEEILAKLPRWRRKRIEARGRELIEEHTRQKAQKSKQKD